MTATLSLTLDNGLVAFVDREPGATRSDTVESVLRRFRDVRRDLRPDILVVPITTHPGPLRVALPLEPAVRGLHTASYATCETVGPVHKTGLKARIGRIPHAGRQEIEAGLRRVTGLPD